VADLLHSFLTEEDRSATVRAQWDVQVAALTRVRWTELSRRRPDIAVVLYRNLSIGLGRKLRRAR